MSEKDKNLPELFKEIIRHDNELDDFVTTINSRKVVMIDDAVRLKELKDQKRRLIIAAEGYIASSRKGPN